MENDSPKLNGIPKSDHLTLGHKLAILNPDYIVCFLVFTVIPSHDLYLYDLPLKLAVRKM
jgi:hypothetical protein